MNPAYLMVFVGKCLEESELTALGYVTEESIAEYLLNREEVVVPDAFEINQALGCLCEANFITMYSGDREGVIIVE